MHRPLVDVPDARVPGAILQSRGRLAPKHVDGRKVSCSLLVGNAVPVRRALSQSFWRRSRSRLYVTDRWVPMSAIYPLHLQREIDRRWFQRSEDAAPVRTRLKVVPVDGSLASAPKQPNFISYNQLAYTMEY